MGRTLYINQSSRPVVLRDGPSVWVKEPHRAGRRIPARLISRVVIIGNVTLESGVINLFAERNIPVIFMNSRKKESAVMIPYNHRMPIQFGGQMILLDSRKNIRRFKEWASARRELLQLKLISKFRPRMGRYLRRKGLGNGNYQVILRRFRSVSMGRWSDQESCEERWGAVKNLVKGLFVSMISEKLVRAGFDLNMGVIHQQRNLGFVLDLLYIMDAEIDLQTLQFFKVVRNRSLLHEKEGAWIVQDEGIRDIAVRFENRRKKTEALTAKIIREILSLIREASL
jgi:CRISPR/Cas system-associated endonuclease Cas1